MTHQPVPPAVPAVRLRDLVRHAWRGALRAAATNSPNPTVKRGRG
ncbi:hypothetical protein ACFV3R_07935 [Streptomyces sp. NPDC059740]